MKLSTVAATFLLFSQAHASPDVDTSTRRMRSVKLYSSASQKGADNYINVLDVSQHRQRVLKHNSKPKPDTTESAPIPTLEMSMPTATSMPDQQQSFSYSQQDSISASTAFDVVDPYIGLPDERKQRDLKHNSKPKPGRYPTSAPTLEMSMPTGASMSSSYPLKQESTSTEGNDAMIRRRELGKGKGKGKRPKPTSAPTLEMSMPTGASMSMSISYSDQDSASEEENVDPSSMLHRRAAEEHTSAARISDYSSVVVVSMVSLIAGVVVWV